MPIYGSESGSHQKQIGNAFQSVINHISVTDSMHSVVVHTFAITIRRTRFVNEKTSSYELDFFSQFTFVLKQMWCENLSLYRISIMRLLT